MESTLRAVWSWNAVKGCEEVGIYFGSVRIGLVDPASYGVMPSGATQGDESWYFAEEKQRVLDETAAKWLTSKLVFR